MEQEADEVAAAVGITANGALLLRPDGVVGWRCNDVALDPEAALKAAWHRLTGH